jgi:hypothetical protein
MADMDDHAEDRAVGGGVKSTEPPAGDQMFEVRVAGLVSDEALDRLRGVTVSSQELRTVLTGHFRDQAELHGFLARLRSLNLDIVEIRRVPGARLPDPHGAGDA